VAIFTSERIARLSPGSDPPIVSIVATTLELLAPRYGVHTHFRRAHFIAQVAHESGSFKQMVENLNYSDPERIARIFRRPFDLDRDGLLDPEEIEFAKKFTRKPEALANRAYANRIGNGDETSGDGWRYRGRGLIQLTGRDNYRLRGASLGVDLVGDPNKAADPAIATEIALDFWRSKKCNDAADLDDVEKVTRLINGGVNGLDDRKRLTERAKTIFPDQPQLIA